MPALHWTYKSFEELTNRELYAIIQLRIEIFSVEQNCAYQDADNKDFLSFHLCAWDEKTLVAYCRILPPELSFKEASIGRVVTAATYRKKGTGRALMQKAIALTLQQFNCHQVTIGAQLYLNKFYNSLGFSQVSDTYLEDGIPHVEMRYTA
jgi:ElaA protein